jgi:simple sugar transport system ATP-binding protein
MGDDALPTGPDHPDAHTLELAGLTKAFGANTVLKGVDLTLVGGRVTALLGANGAGKSTLIKILSGVHAPTSGRVLVDGEEVALTGPADAAALGIRTVHQRIDEAIVPGLSVAENLLFEEIGRGELPRVRSLRGLLPRARKVAETLDLDWSDAVLRRDVHELGIADCQMLLLARALVTTPRVLILDEPTSTLSGTEAARLFDVVRRLRDRGVAVVYVSHRLAEIDELAEEVAVLRDGRIVDHQVAPFRLTQAVSAMLGESIVLESAEHDELVGDDIALHLEGHRIFPESPELDLDLRHGEVTGVIGLIGAGKTELAEHLFGAVHGDGRMTLDGAPYHPRHPRQAVSRGVFLVPEDRAAQGMLPGWSVARTLSLPFLARLSRAGIVDRRREQTSAASAIERFRVTTTGGDQGVDALSGGNQQKVMVARWMQADPTVLLLDEPFRGVDIGARREIAHRAREQAASGACVVVLSSDVEEIREMADRILVLVDGAVVLDARAGEISNDQIAQSMSEVA